MAVWKLMSWEDITSHDIYEIAYAHSYPPKHWSKDSLYLTDDEKGMQSLSPYFDKVFPAFAYYGPQKISLPQWKQLKEFCLQDPHRPFFAENFFHQVDQWLSQGNQQANYFWILGI